jgi:hypothetical protein
MELAENVHKAGLDRDISKQMPLFEADFAGRVGRAGLPTHVSR